MAEEQKPVTVEPVAPATDAAPTETKPVESTPAAEPAAETTEAPAAATTETATEEPAKTTEEPAKEAPKEAEPIYKGTLKYVTGNPLKTLLTKPAFHFYFGEEAVKAEELKHTVKFQEASGRETAAWSNETGNGILYYVREAASKTGPPGAILLHSIEDLKKVGSDKINFKLHGTQHNVIAGSPTDRDGWYKAFEEKIAEAKSMKDDILNKDTFKETLEKLTKPTGMVLGTAAVATPAVQENMPKRSVEERKARSEAKKDAKAAKDRSQSRGKKFFEQFRAKKEAKAPEEPVPATEEPAAPEGEAAAVAEEPAAATEAVEPAAETPAAPVEAAETAAVTEAAKPEEKKSRRGSKFIDRLKSFGSPTQEKKPEEVLPVEEAAVAETAAPEPAAEVPEEAAATTEAEPTTNGDHKAEEKPAEAAIAPPAEKQERRRSSFFDFTQFKLPGKGKKAETATKDEPAVEDVAAEDVAAKDVKPAEDVEPAAETAAPETTETTETKEPAPKTEKKTAASGLIGLIRSGSKAIRGNREGKKAKAPEKVEEAKTETAEETKTEEAKPDEPATTEAKTEETPAAPAAIGDVVPEAVTIGTPAPAASQTVTASA